MDSLAKKFHTLEDRAQSLETRETPAVTYTNRAPRDVIAGEVMVINPSEDETVVFAPSAGAPAPVVVVTDAAMGHQVKCSPRGYGEMSIMCDGPEISPGDAIVASATAGYGQVDNSATARNMLGIAVTSKDAGDAAPVIVLI